MHTPSHAAHVGAGHDGKFQDLLPPRKRLLAGLKHVSAGHPSISGSCTSTLAQCQYGGEACTDTTPPSTLLLPPRSLLLHSPIQKCFSCGDGSVLLHRVPCLAGSTSYLCSSCVLLSNKKLYCVSCLQIIKEDLLTPSSTPSPSLLTCCRCQRLTHLDCTLKMWSPSLQGSTLCKDCHARNIGQSRDQPLSKKQKMANVRRSKQAVVSACKVKLPVVDKEALVAAKIVALAAKRDFLEAKQRAMVLAKAAACASARAKAALDNVYKMGQRQAEKEEHASGVDIECMDDMSITTGKAPRCLKKRALSAIVASETLSRDLTVKNCTAKIEKTKKRRRTIPDTDNGEGLPTKEAAMEATWSRPVQNAKLGIKRRRTLSSLTNFHAVAKSRGSKSPTKKPGGTSSSSTKGKLGAIVSQVLALSKLSKTTKDAEKGRSFGKCGVKLGDAVVNEVQENTCRLPTVADNCLPSSGLTVSADTCRPSHHGVVASCEERVQTSRSFKEWLQYTEAMRANSWGMIQEQLAKNRFGGCEAHKPQQDRKLLNCLTQTMPARKSMYANLVHAAMGAPKQC